jgi:hypothetical protein
MDFKDIIKEFSVVIYGNLEPYNEVLSKARCRIFYKYFNRNGTYISDEFAEKLLSTIAYAPVKGIYDNNDSDYTDHGEERNLGRIYGIVPENYNLTWEPHLDEDGIERIYACVDVLLYTGLYKEASEIINKAQSMELYAPSIKGEFKYIEGRKAFVYEDACFLGLQVLGDDVEPCFEGAAFYSLYQNLKQMIKTLEKYNLDYHNNDNREEQMIFNFKLSDSQKHDMLFNLLNPNFNENGGWVIEYSICDVYDEYAIAYNYENQGYERIYYTKDDSQDSLEINAKKKCYIVDVTEEEKSALETIQALNGGTYEKIDEGFTTLKDENSTYVTKIGEQETIIATLTSDKENFETQINEAQTTIATLNQELDSLKEYKLQQETNEKQAVIDKYAKELDEDVMQKYTEKLNEYSVSDLEKELAFELVNANPTIFSHQTQSGSGYIPKDSHTSGVEGILEKYRK